MQFKVPQFLEIEDKIFGPFTFKEFVYLAGGGGLCFVLYRLLGLGWSILPILAISALSLSLTFYRPNNKPFINMIEASFNYLVQDKLYVWKKHKDKVNKDKQKVGSSEESVRREMLENSSKLNSSKLRDLAWSLDVLDINRHSLEK